jgi:hypothetical protein
MTAPYPFYFVVMPRRTSNLREVRFGEVAVLKQISVLHRKKLVKILIIYFWPAISCAYAPGYIQTFISFTLFDLSNRKPSKKLTFVSCSVLTDFCHYLCLPLDRFLFEFFWSRNFWGSCYSSTCFICGGFELKPEQKRLIRYYAYTNVANRIVLSFVWRKFSSVGIGE